jgi:hypothetical protein
MAIAIPGYMKTITATKAMRVEALMMKADWEHRQPKSAQAVITEMRRQVNLASRKEQAARLDALEARLDLARRLMGM